MIRYSNKESPKMKHRQMITAAASIGLALSITLTSAADAFGRRNDMDINGDGKVDLAELKQMRDEMFAKNDANGDGVLDRTELATLQNTSFMGRGPASENFTTADQNQNGLIERSEFRQGAVRMMKAMDSNGDFVLDRRDFRKLRRRN